MTRNISHVTQTQDFTVQLLRTQKGPHVLVCIFNLREPRGPWEMETGGCLETLDSLAFTAVNNKKLCLKTKLGGKD